MSVYTKHERICSVTGKPLSPVYTSTIDPITGELEIVVDSYVDSFAEIQSYREGCELKSILKRYNSGDVSALHRHEMFYADVTGMPKSLGEVYKFVIDGEHAFNKLPLEVREKYDFNPAKFFAKFDTFDDVCSELVALQKKENSEASFGIMKNDKQHINNFTKSVSEVENIEKEVNIDGNESE